MMGPCDAMDGTWVFWMQSMYSAIFGISLTLNTFTWQNKPWRVCNMGYYLNSSGNNEAQNWFWTWNSYSALFFCSSLYTAYSYLQPRRLAAYTKGLNITVESACSVGKLNHTFLGGGAKNIAQYFWLYLALAPHQFGVPNTWGIICCAGPNLGWLYLRQEP